MGTNRVFAKAVKEGPVEIKCSLADVSSATYKLDIKASSITLHYDDSDTVTKVLNIEKNANISDLIAAAIKAEKIADPETYVSDSYFAGWYTKPEGNGEKVLADTVFTNQRDLYGNWIENEVDFYIAPVGNYTYTGSAIKPSVSVYAAGKLLTENVDYKVSYGANKAVYTGTDTKYMGKITVTGKGLYTKSKIVYFNILPKNLGDSDISSNEKGLVKAVTGKVQKLTPVVTYGKLKLSKNDYTISYPDENEAGAYKDAGVYNIVLTGKGNYTGSLTLQMELIEKSQILINKASVSKLTNEQYTGDPITPELTIKHNKKELKENVDYELEYVDNVEIGTATINIYGIGGYSGMVTKTFKIVGNNLQAATVTGISNMVFTGDEITFDPDDIKVTVKINRVPVTVAPDNYDIDYINNVNAGRATLIITGKNDSFGTKKVNFNITKVAMSSADIKAELEDDGLDIVYTKNGAKPSAEVSYNGLTLIEGKDYTIKYSNNNSVNDGSGKKQPTATITGKGNFSGSIKKTFTITEGNLEDLEDNLWLDDVIESKVNNKWKSNPVITDSNGIALKANVDYTLEYSYAETATMLDGSTREKDAVVDAKDHPVAGSQIKVTLTGTKNYVNEATGIYTIVQSNIKDAKITIKSKSYNYGKPVVLSEDDITVTYKGVKLVYGMDYKIDTESYLNNENTGTASFIIEGIGKTTESGTADKNGNQFFIEGKKRVSFKIVAKNID